MGAADLKFVADAARALAALIDALPLAERVEALNTARLALHEVSPFRGEPVDCVLWVDGDLVHANDYNPNTVAPPEMRLLAHSIETDGYTQPIVTCPLTDDAKEAPVDVVVDGFHRNRVGKENDRVRARVHGYLPISRLGAERRSRNDLMAATVRHNRARGEHGVERMTSLVGSLVTLGWKDERIMKELGMELDEVLRLKQVSGLASLFRDREFSEAWEPVEVDP